MSRVMHCVSNLRFGGVERLLTDVLAYWAKQGARHEHVLCAFAGGPLEEQTIPVLDGANMRHHVLGRTSRYSAAFRRALVRTVNEVRPDIINTCDPGAAFWTRLLRKRFDRRPRIVVQCGGVGVFSQHLWRGIERFLLPRADGFIFCSETTRRIWEHYLPIDVARAVIHNGIPADKDPAAAIDEPPSMPVSPFRLLSISRLVPIKGITAQIDALRLLHDRGMDDITLTLVGDGAARADLEAQARRLGLAEAVKFTGFRSEPHRFHRQAHVFLSTSYNETFGIAVAEAMLGRLVCVAASAGGPSEIIEHERSGFLVPCTQPVPKRPKTYVPAVVYDHSIGVLRPARGVDTLALADRIADVRQRYHELTDLREAARQRILDAFSMGVYANSLEAFYDGATEEGQR